MDDSRERAGLDAAIEEAEAGWREGGIPIGSVLLDEDGAIVARGRNRRVQEGDPTAHAEVDCLQSEVGHLQSATLYVTLEPCSTHGRTPPCTDLILAKGVGRVVVSVTDRNPKHAGRGLEILKNAGVETVCGVCEAEGRALVAPFEKRITTGMPYVTLKLASTLDGRIADADGNSKWITGPEAREREHEPGEDREQHHVLATYGE